MGKSILVVDDEQSNIDLFKEFLEDEDHVVNIATNGRVALEFLEGNKTDVVLLDLMMPEMDGFEVLKRLQANPAFDSIKKIVVTGMAGSEIEERVRGLGGDCFFLKPVDLNQLIEEVERN